LLELTYLEDPRSCLLLKFLAQVRYQSRKRLAEQRPRVKGQFVRQVRSDHPVSDLGGDSWNYFIMASRNYLHHWIKIWLPKL